MIFIFQDMTSMPGLDGSYNAKKDCPIRTILIEALLVSLDWMAYFYCPKRFFDVNILRYDKYAWIEWQLCNA